MENNEQLDYMNNNSTSIHVGKRIEGQILNIVNDEICRNSWVQERWNNT